MTVAGTRDLAGQGCPFFLSEPEPEFENEPCTPSNSPSASPTIAATRSGGRIFAADAIDMARQYPTHAEAVTAAASIRNIRGEEMATEIVAVPLWAADMTGKPTPEQLEDWTDRR